MASRENDSLFWKPLKSQKYAEKKTKDQLAQEKLNNIQVMFKLLETKLSKKEKLSGKYLTLADGIKDYNFGLKHDESELCYDACKRVYQIFKLRKYLNDDNLKTKIKVTMKQIGNEYFPGDTNSLQLRIVF